MGFFRRAKAKRKPQNGKALIGTDGVDGPLVGYDDSSIGERLAPHDQFYLEVPIKRVPVLAGILRKHGVGEFIGSQDRRAPNIADLDQVSTVSSLTFVSGAHSSLHGGPRHQQGGCKTRNQSRGRPNSTGCCAFSRPTTADDQSIAASTIPTSKTQQQRKSKGSGFSWFVCCASNTNPDDLNTSSNNTALTTPSQYQHIHNALFDTLEDDEAGEAIKAEKTIAMAEMDRDDATANTKGSRWKRIRRIPRVRSIPKLRSFKWKHHQSKKSKRESKSVIGGWRTYDI